MAEKETLGIFVPTNKHIDHLIGIARAAKKAGKALYIFFTHKGVLMTQDPKFQELADIAFGELSLCNHSWEEFGFSDKPIPHGMSEDDLGSQSRHVALIEKCDRYLVI
jgi:hypothetical protein